ncbi:MAG: hypothetical protein GEU78_13920 [Actinobacteria bacterium]|nr:hypothetical protein [Actinomycetota bacterium]
MSRNQVQTSAPRYFPLMLNAWRALLALTVGLFALSVPERYEQLEALARSTQLAEGPSLTGFLQTASSPGIYPLVVTGLEVSFVVALLLVSAGIASGRIDDWRRLFFSAVFVTYSVWVTPTLDSLSGDPILGPIGSLVQAVGLIFAIHFFLLFPDGRFIPRWGRISSVFWIAYTLAWALRPDAWYSLIDPFQVPFAVFATLMFGWLTGLVAQTVRYRSNATPDQRRQTRWVVIAIAGAVAAYGAVYLPGLFIAETGAARVAFDLFGVPAFWLLAMPMAFALGFAMLRHQLFDFHAVINRTLVYGSLTALLGGIYLGVVTLLGQILGPVAGTSDLAVAGSTLTVAALFKPALSRIQQVIDRRFYRTRYDAALAVERFTTRLRGEVDLGSLRDDLIELVSETVQPTTASLWLLKPLESAGGDASPSGEESTVERHTVRRQSMGLQTSG